MKMKWAIEHRAKYRVVLEKSNPDGGCPGAILAEVCFRSMAVGILKELKQLFPGTCYGVYLAGPRSLHRHYHYIRVTGTEEV